MSYCKSEGKDKIIFVTKEDQQTPSSLTLEEYSDGEPGLIREDGSINWNCPCLGGMATGPCGFEFRAAFSCFHNSTEDPKGSECFDDFRRMQECMVSYPSLYDSKSDDKDEDLGDVFANAEGEGGNEQRDSEREQNSETKDKETDKTSTDSNKTKKEK